MNPDRIDAAFSDELRRHYSEEEIIELGAFIGFNIGYHTFFGTLKFYPMFAPDGRLVSQEESARIYGDKPVSLAAGGARDRHRTAAGRCAGGRGAARLIAQAVALGVPDERLPESSLACRSTRRRCCGRCCFRMPKAASIID